jgi:hypothetical protein
MDRYSWTNPALWLFWLVLWGYVVASVAALALKEWRIGRYVPVVSVLAPILCYFVPASNGLVRDTRLIGGLLVSLVLLPVVAALAWKGRRLTEHVLRVTSIVLFIHFLLAVMTQPIT